MFAVLLSNLWMNLYCKFQWKGLTTKRQHWECHTMSLLECYNKNDNKVFSQVMIIETLKSLVSFSDFRVVCVHITFGRELEQKPAVVAAFILLIGSHALVLNMINCVFPNISPWIATKVVGIYKVLETRNNSLFSTRELSYKFIRVHNSGKIQSSDWDFHAIALEQVVIIAYSFIGNLKKKNRHTCKCNYCYCR